MDETTGTAGTTDPADRHAALVAAIEEANRRYYVEDAPTLTDWAGCVQQARQRLLLQDDLLTQLLRWVLRGQPG